MRTYRIFVINPGSTSTKLSLHENDRMVFSTDVFHDSSVLRQFGNINNQLDYRMQVIDEFLKEEGLDLTGIDAIVGRGGGCYSLPGGIYDIDDQMIMDTRNCAGNLYHSSNLGVQMARRLWEKYGGRLFTVNPPVVDELQDVARITGVKGVYRKAICHALNLKAVAHKYCAENGLDYDHSNLIVCHIDGGISLTAHHNGRMIDGNDAGGGQGPFTPTRMGSMAVTDVINELKGCSYEEIKSLCAQSGGLSSHFGTSNSDKIHAMVENGDEYASLIWEAMTYQVCKGIGSLACVLSGKVDAIVLTGGLLRFDDIVDQIRERCGWIAPIALYPGEYEHESMAHEALRVLQGEISSLKYPGRPVFEGFDYEVLR